MIDITPEQKFLVTFCYIINKQGGDDLSSVTSLREAENVFSINRIIFLLWSAETQLHWKTINQLRKTPQQRQVAFLLNRSMCEHRIVLTMQNSTLHCKLPLNMSQNI